MPRSDAALAQTYTAVNTYYSSPTEVMPLARDAAQRALALDPSSRLPCHAGQRRLLFDWDWPAAEREYQRREINPNLPEANLGFATYLRRSAASMKRSPRHAGLPFRSARARKPERSPVDLLLLRSHARDRHAVRDHRRGTRSRPAVCDARPRECPSRPARGCHPGGRTAVQLSNSPTILTTTASALARAGERAEARQLLVKRWGWRRNLTSAGSSSHSVR